MVNSSNLLQQARAMSDQLSAWRRDFHQHPELGFKEIQTANRVAEILNSLGYRVRTGVGRTGVVAEMGSGAPMVALRADMDALPILEATGTPYASQNPGVMHACGHDTHITSALGAAALLAQQTFAGRIRFLFQPAEEVNDDQGVSGAPRMIEAGAMEGVSAIFALHADPTFPVGSIAVQTGPASAGVDTLFATIIGKGGHGAYPHKVVDPIYLSAHVILALHGIVSRRLYPFDPAVLSICSIHGGKAENVIPEQVELLGTIRYMETHVQKQIHTEIAHALEITRPLGGDYEYRIEIGYPPMINAAGAVEVICEAARDLLGTDNILPRPSEMGAEDFGFFSTIAPGAMFRLGCRIDGDERKLHHSHFDIDERCLPVGAAMLAAVALRYLEIK